jgi:hypothetical protein
MVSKLLSPLPLSLPHPHPHPFLLLLLFSPNYDTVLAQQLQKFHGSIDEISTIHDILPTVQTGDLHIAFYDLTDEEFYVSFMRKADADESEPHYAYERQFTKLDMKKLFEVTTPTV